MLWSEELLETTMLRLTPEDAKARLHAVLPPVGQWLPDFRPDAAVWAPPGATGRDDHISQYLEISPSDTGVCVKSETTLAVGDVVVTRLPDLGCEFEVSAVLDGSARVRRRIMLPPSWQRIIDDATSFPFYFCSETGKVQWDFPELPQSWQAAIDPNSK